MQGDLPHTLYLRSQDKKRTSKVEKPFRYNPDDPAIAKQLEANRKAAERRAAKQKGSPLHNLNELIKK